MGPHYGDKSGAWQRLGNNLRQLLGLGRTGESGTDLPFVPWCLEFRTDGLRAFPPTGLGDTILGTAGGSPYESTIHLFRADEILSVHRSHRDWFRDGAGPTARYNPAERSPGAFALAGQYAANAAIVFRDIDPESSPPLVRHLIPQRAQRSCGYAAGAMIALDALCRYGKTPDIASRFIDNIPLGTLSTPESIARLLNLIPTLRGAGLEAVSTDLRGGPLPALTASTEQFGSVMLSIGGEIGGHFVVVDTPKRNATGDVESFRLRDPYHGWDITVTAVGLRQRMSHCEKTVVIRPHGGS